MRSRMHTSSPRCEPSPVPTARRESLYDGGERFDMTDRADPSRPTAWADLVIGLYDSLVGRDAEVVYEFDHLEVDVPDSAGADAAHARWTVDGTLKIRARDRR